MVFPTMAREPNGEGISIGLFVPVVETRRTVVSIINATGNHIEFAPGWDYLHDWLFSKKCALVVVDLDDSPTSADHFVGAYSKLHGSGCEPVLVVLSDNSTRRNFALSAGAIHALRVPIDPEEAMSQLALAVRTARLLERFRNDHHRLESEVHRSTQLLNITRLEVTRRLGRAAEFRDNETGRHIIRVSKTAEMLARALGLSNVEVELVFHASPLHDVGKIGIPDRILMKPGPLTDAEWETMKRHPVIGEQILAGSDDPLISTARSVALNHHERWDGNGYPRGLKGSAIPLEGRIVAICDVFDALTSTRPYKAPWDFPRAFDYIEQQSGKQFDPEIASLFLALRSDITEVARYYAEPEQEEGVWFEESESAAGESDRKGL